MTVSRPHDPFSPHVSTGTPDAPAPEPTPEPTTPEPTPEETAAADEAAQMLAELDALRAQEGTDDRAGK